MLLAVEAVPLKDAVVDVPSLPDKGLPAELTHVHSGLREVISGYAPAISSRNPSKRAPASPRYFPGFSPRARTNLLNAASLIMNSGSPRRSITLSSGVPILLASFTMAL